MFDVIFWVILDLFLFLLIVLFGLKYIVNFIDKECEILRKFFIKREGFLGLLFLLLFSGEQLLFLLFFHKFSYRIDSLRFGVSIFALIVITTASIQRIILEIKNRFFKYELERTGKENLIYLKDLKSFIDENESLLEEDENLKKRIKILESKLSYKK